jgi:hypothetical protein
MGENSYKLVKENFSINEQNVEIIDNIYSVEYDTDEKEN